MTIIIPDIHHAPTVFFSHGHNATTTMHHHSHQRHAESAFGKDGNNSENSKPHYMNDTASSKAKSRKEILADLENLKNAELTCQKCFSGIRLDADLSAKMKQIFTKAKVNPSENFEEIRKICSDKLRACAKKCPEFLEPPKIATENSSEFLIYASFWNRENSSRMNFLWII